MVRDRLLLAADRLFYREGVRAVGIDRILAEADAAKASLYQHFGGKDRLVAAYLEGRVAAARRDIETFMAAVPPEARAVRFFDWVVAWVGTAGFRGCPLQHVMAEINRARHPAGRVIAAQRAWLHERFAAWSAAAGVAHPQTMAGQLMVLFDGAMAAAEQDGPQRAADARMIARVLLGRAAGAEVDTRRRAASPRGKTGRRVRPAQEQKS